MGTSLTKNLKLIKFDDNEPIDNTQMNSNWDKLENKVTQMEMIGLPDGKTPRVLTGYVLTSTGAGGVDRTKANATDTSGVGALWPGYQGIPGGWERILAVQLTQFNSTNSGAFDVFFSVKAMTPDVIRYQAFRRDSIANNFGTLGIMVTISGY